MVSLSVGDRPRKLGRMRRASIVSVACVLSLLAGFIIGKQYRASEGQPAQIIAKQQSFPKPKEVCLNTCAKARDGVCDEGRKQVTDKLHQLVACDLGTDCDDCGPWQPSAPVPWMANTRPGPMEDLKSRQVEVRVKLTRTQPPFLFAYTDPSQDTDVSRFMDTTAVIEAGITKIFYQIFKEKCIKIDGSRSLFVDVGANFGWFSLLAAKMGCRVLAFEPVPHFRAFFEYSVHVNGLAHLIDIRTNVVSHVGGQDLEMVVPSRGYWGTAGIDGLNIDKNIKNSTSETIRVPSVLLGEVVQEDVLLMKVDVEGWEWAVLQGAQKLFALHNVENVILEYSPGVAERHFKHDNSISTVRMLVNLLDDGFRIGHIDDEIKGHTSFKWDTPLPALQEVTRGNLRYDMEDVMRAKAGKLGAPIPPELQKFEAWAISGAIPEDMNPRSFRSILGHNTNIWASKSRSLQHLQGTVGLFNINDPASKFFIDNQQHTGMGNRACQPLLWKVQVRHRCRCTEPEKCGQEEHLVLELARQGRLPNNYILL